jgi:diguanylate cyclase (GGDEF)-like protein/PAS domain S-box-containing protein
MWDWLHWLFGTDGFVPRWHCGDWPEALGWLHIVSDVTIFVAYVTIPCVLASLILRRRDLPFPRLFRLFSVFIFSCGAVHLVEAMIFWSPLYPLSGVLKGVTAVVSVATVLALVPAMRSALALPGFQKVTARLAAIVSASRDAIISKNIDGTIESWNDGAAAIYGYSEAEIVGKNVCLIVPEDLRDDLEALNRRVRRGERILPFETERMTRSGQRIPVSLTLSPVRDLAGKVVGISSISRDITPQKLSERQTQVTARRLERANQRLRRLADRDPLTGLLNRRGVEAALATEAARMQRNGSHAAVLLIDCDDFKQVNERLGHRAGDQVLCEIASRIGDAARDSDHVARVGGDEFLVVLPDTRPSEAMPLAHRLRRAIVDTGMPTANGEVVVSISCGVAALDPAQATVEAILTHTGSGLKMAKLRGKNTVTSATAARDAGRLPGAGQLRALAQAIVDVSSGAVTGYEFLIRGPVGPLEMPDHLFRAHRENETVTALDLACLDNCIAAARGLADDQRAHVNILPGTLLEVRADQIVSRVLAAHRPERLCLELNEALLGGDLTGLVRSTSALRAVTNCRLAIDDVGFGRSSLEALILLEPDVIKIDRHFVHGIAHDSRQRHRLQRLIQVGQVLGAEIIAEGVEREEDRRVLVDLGVRLAQGYLWGRPAALN